MKETGSQQPKGRIVVGVDCSEASKGPLLWAARQAVLTNASLEVVFAWQAPLMASGYAVPGTAGTDPESGAKQMLDAAIHSVLDEPDGLEVVPIVARGHAARILLDVARGADLLVVGSRGHTPLVGMILGSVSAHCLGHATCPVVVVHQHQKAA